MEPQGSVLCLQQPANGPVTLFWEHSSDFITSWLNYQSVREEPVIDWNSSLVSS